MSRLEIQKEAFGRLLVIMDELREQCPWDRKQTMESLRPLTIEELYELTDAILEGDPQEVKKELGDVLLHLVFYARIASEKKEFDIGDVITSLCEKLIHRHPHIYGDVVANDEETVKQNWEKLKLAEGNTSVLAGVPNSLPALVKAYRIQEKAAQVGFDWPHVEQVLDKVNEELAEFKKESELQKQEEEFGDLLFAIINYGRHLGINPENALERTNRKFRFRFQYIEKRAQESGKSLEKMSLEEMDLWWEEAKKLSKQG